MNTNHHQDKFANKKTECPCGRSDNFNAFVGNTQAGTCWSPDCTGGIITKDGCARFIPPQDSQQTTTGECKTAPAKANRRKKDEPAYYALVEKYHYVNEDDISLYDSHRKEGRNKDGSIFKDEHGFKKKDFRQYKAGTFDPIGNTRRVLYRLPQVIEAVQDAKAIFIVEGEKDVHTLERLGFTATTIAGGGKAPWLADYSQHLQGATVVILPDNDKIGKQYAEKVARGLQGIANSIHVVELPNLPEKGDVTDFIENGGSREDILCAIQECQPYQECQAKDILPFGNLSTWADTRELVQATEWIWEGYLSKGYVTMFASYAGVGKSFVVLDIAGMFTNGKEFPDGTRVEETGKVLWIETEHGQALHMERGEAFGIDFTQIANPLKDALETVSLENPKHREQIKAIAQREDIKLIVLDSLSGSHNLQENSTEVKSVLSFLAELARDTNKPIIVTHHLNKMPHDGTPSLNHVRGSTAITQFCRIICIIDAPNKETPERKRLSVIKNNLGKEEPPIGFEIKEDGILFTDAPEPSALQSALDTAREFLSRFLTDGERPQKEIELAANAEGISTRTLNRAKKELKVTSRKEYNIFTKKSTWYWSIPKQDCQKDGGSDDGNVDLDGNLPTFE